MRPVFTVSTVYLRSVVYAIAQPATTTTVPGTLATEPLGSVPMVWVLGLFWDIWGVSGVSGTGRCLHGAVL